MSRHSSGVAGGGGGDSGAGYRVPGDGVLSSSGASSDGEAHGAAGSTVLMPASSSSSSSTTSSSCCGGAQRDGRDCGARVRGAWRSFVMRALHRDVVGFFVLGLINNFGYVVMLSAAGDLMRGHPGFSEGYVLMADILPTLVIKLVGPWFMHRIPYGARVLVFTAFAMGAFQIVAWVDDVGVRLLGVACASIASGGGELTFLALSSYYDPSTVAGWSSGTGGAGVFGALAYLALTSWIPWQTHAIGEFWTLMICTPFPLLMIVMYWAVLSKRDAPIVVVNRQSADPATESLITPKPRRDSRVSEDAESQASEVSTLLAPRQPTLREKLQHVPPLLQFMIPLAIVYFAEYFINQGLDPSLVFANSPFACRDHYVYYQFLYQSGVLVSRSSVACLRIRRVWIPAVLQVAVMFFLLTQVLWNYLPSVFIVFFVILFEGLLGGAAYVNTFYNIAADTPAAYKEFAMSIATVSDSVGISFSALTSILSSEHLQAIAIAHGVPLPCPG